MNLKSPDFLCNIKRFPDKQSSEYNKFWENETNKIKYGVTVDGVFIHPWLYWHTQMWNIYLDKEDPINGRTVREIHKAEFRDNEWIIAEGLKEAQDTKKGILLFGSRRLGKSDFLASHIAHNATVFKGSENAVTGGNWSDIDIIVAKAMMGLDLLPDYYKMGRISENPRKEIELGYRVKKSGVWVRTPWSKIIMRNFDNGNNTEGAAGITATSFVIDEVGKFPFAQCYAAAKPAFTGRYGQRCVPILTGTSGDIQASSDAEKFFMAPEAHNFIMRELPEEGNKKVSIFISGLRRMEGKYDTTIAGYIKTEHNILVPETSELYTIKFSNSDFKKAEAIIDEERAAASKSPDQTELLKATMYYPKNTKELFLHDDGNNFPIEAINEHIEYLLANPELQGIPVKLYRGPDTKVRISYNTTKQAIIDYPLKPETSKDSTPIIYEPPDDNSVFYRYISGCDPYNQSGSKWSSSLGSCYIYKRTYDPLNGTFQRRIVASYTARPGSLKEFHETVELLLELYNASCMPENEASTFIQYFDHKNKGYMLADGYDFLKEIAPKTSIPSSRTKGLPATTKVQQYYKELIYQYLMEEIVTGINAETGELIKKLGVCRIPDIGLLREFAAYSELGGNYDRYVAFGHTLAYEAWADKIYPYIQKDINSNSEVKDKTIKNNRPKVRSPFDIGPSNPFSSWGGSVKTKSGNPFGFPTKK